MMLFQRRLLVELLWNALTTLLLITAVLVLILCAQLLHRSEGMTLLTFVKAVPALASVHLDLTLPLSVLVAVVITYGRAAADNEVDTLRASGVHPVHLVTPGLVFGAFASFVLLVGMDFVQPGASRSLRRLMHDTDLAELLRNKLSAGEPVRLDDRTVITAEGFDESGRAQGMRVQLYDDEGNLESEYVANEAELKLNRQTGSFEFTLYDYTSVKGAHVKGKQTVIERSLPKDIADLSSDHLATPQLLAFLRRAPERRGGFTELRAQLAVDLRFSSAAACVLFVLLGLPVALIFRRNDRTGAFLVAFLLTLFVYFPSQQIAMALTRDGTLSSQVACWSGNGFMLLVGSALSWRVFRR
jgi:lipopolysaccharide export system permease protein